MDFLTEELDGAEAAMFLNPSGLPSVAPLLEALPQKCSMP